MFIIYLESTRIHNTPHLHVSTVITEIKQKYKIYNIVFVQWS